MAQPTATLAELRSALTTGFSPDELRTLCEDLNADPNAIPYRERGIPTRAQEILAYFKRRGQLDDLVGYCAQQRPLTDWHRFVGLGGLADDPEVESVSAGLVAMRELMQVPLVIKAVADLQNDLRQAREQFHVLDDYKGLHDQLHELQFGCYILLETNKEAFPGDARFLKDLIDYELTFSDVVESCKQIAKRPNTRTTTELTWIRKLDEAWQLLKGAMEQLEKPRFDKAVERTREIIRVQPTQINGRLKDAARNMNLNTVMQKLGELREELRKAHLGPEDQQRLADFEDGVNSLTDLNDQLQRLVTSHDKWQEMEDQLKHIETDPPKNLIDEFDGWAAFQEVMQPIYINSADEWAARLCRDAEKIQAALGANKLADAADVFSRFRKQAGLRFYQVDTELVQQCKRIGDIGSKLDSVLKLS